MPTERSNRDWLRWVRRGFFALTDQGLISGSNFLLTIFLARWLTPEQYGVYALAFSIFLFLSAWHQALLLEPMTVLSASSDSRYRGALLWIQIFFSVAVFILFGAAAWVTMRMHFTYIATALFGLMAGAPGILLFWFARTSCYVELASGIAAAGSMAYSIVILGGAWELSRVARLSTELVFALMGATGLLVGIVLLVAIRVGWPASRQSLRDAVERHWKYGRWALGSSLVIWVPGNLFYSVIAGVLGLSSAGAFRALMNLTVPVTHGATALAMLFQPQVSRTAAQHGADSTKRPVARVAALFGLGACAWLILVAVFSGPLWELLYRGRFQAASGLSNLLLIGVVVQVIAYAPAIGLRALQTPSYVFYAYSIAAVACLGGGIPAIHAWGLAGAVGSYSGSLLLSCLATIALYGKRVSQECRPLPITPRDPNRLKILLSAYACEPGRGSEPGVGWNWVREFARDNEVWVITRSNNRVPIERALARHSLPSAHFVYYDLPRWARFWKRGSSGLRLYYYLWQAGVYFVARRLTRECSFDFVHHVTLVKYWAPSFIGCLGVPFIWGPIGGGESAPLAFRSAFSARGKIYDIVRTAARSLSDCDPFVGLTARRATISLASTEDTAARLRALGCEEVHVFPGVALNDQDLRILRRIGFRHEDPFRIMSLGNLLHLKGFDLALRAFARFVAAGGDGEYWLIGDGPERRRLEDLAQRLGIAEHIRFWGRLPRPRALARLAECDVLAHPTLHDSGGWTCLEAMAAGKPVVCLDLGGPALQVTAETGIKIPAITPDQVVNDIGVAFETLARNSELRRRMGEVGRLRVYSQFRWEDKPTRLLQLCGLDARQGVAQ
ncbi:MAG TPA: glycosyltransferase [Bryobacteraceae bacterium]|nr:glycosyltransferase [Bryobacteraceae bacterium]